MTLSHTARRAALALALILAGNAVARGADVDRPQCVLAPPRVLVSCPGSESPRSGGGAALTTAALTGRSGSW
jgi:hypothetical protein